MQTNELNLTCSQTILSHCFDFVLQGCFGEWDQASTRLPTYLCHRGPGQDVVQKNWILKKNDFFFLKWDFSFFFFGKKQISIFFFFLNKMWSFEKPFWKIILFKNQTNLFDYERSRLLNSCYQNLLLSFEHCQIKSPKAIKKWNVILFRNHIVGWKQGECSKFEISFESFKDFRIWEIVSLEKSSCGVWQF